MEDILFVIKDKKTKFTKKEGILAAYVTVHYRNVPEMSVQKLAKEAGVSAATVVRFCHTIGLKGYFQLKLLLMQLKENIDSYGEIKKGESVQQVIKKLEQQSSNALNLTIKALDPHVVESLIDQLHESSAVYLYSAHNSELITSYIQQKLELLKIPVIKTASYKNAMGYLEQAPQKSVFVYICELIKTQEVKQLFTIARKKEIHSVMLTTNQNTAKLQLAETVLLTKNIKKSSFYPQFTTVIEMQFFMAQVIFYGYLAKYGDEVKKKK
ncbi:MurR/RpiR family transcriptional regulator [Liquorilactobacillus oeni]|uniref:Transcriptional regulator n=1 Tax=Liquorilactobacillus oeni DSM 19972 TaxID=1423777 RepID=A0A0R1M8S6_9LACO|nr:MurR/RpiR family transcriptional regulator [Liquorilactobacillus oeni]KRL04508.1 transcriptional regulator [Liquorilactobacillus oeni DSM 19972]